MNYLNISILKNCFVLCVAIFTLLSCGEKKVKNEPTKTNLSLLKETKGLPALESVIFDKESNLLYVSLQAAKEPGDGSIASLSLEGEILNLQFTTGLGDPKGMAIIGDRLYVSDVLDLVEIDLKTGNVINKYTGDKVRYFNDVTADVEGNIYVTDMHSSSIYKLDTDKKLTEWFASPELESANGLLAVGNELIIGGWGYFTDGKALFAPQGRLLKMDIATQKISRITPDPIGNIDGVQVLDDNSYIVSDWKEGKVFQVFKNGEMEELLDTERGAADLTFIRDKNLLILPLNKENKLQFYEIN